MRLIDADAFDKVLKDAQTECRKNGGNFRFGVLGDVRGNLAVFPTVDRPEIVRCKDCKQYREGIDIDGKPFTRCNGDVRVYGHTKPDWFCADGKRRDDDA